MTSDILIRRAQIGDAAAMVRYMTVMIAENLDTLSRRTVPTLEEEHAFIEKAAATNSLILLALDGDEVIGMLDIKVGEREHVQHSGLLGVAVTKPWRGKGLGRRFIQAAIDEMKAQPGFCRIELECVVWNPGAKALYEKLGFVVEGVKRKSVNLRGTPEDEYLMALTW